ncbi:CoA-binding protein [Marinobacter sp. M-5]|jgi:predicted CoA-binding protein|uniref:CoA-binding protein n=1 Tax=Marinobacter sp. M-5 TaxID=3081089 RepID=UPI00293C3E38|nr:CoA-binding protein [Marinobacter sp. M-5]MDV3504711.1 CoA-binding protein [Marinobacter sp. M-5]
MSRSNPDRMRQILSTVRTIALVGASDKSHRPSHDVMAYLQSRGYRMIPVNPKLAGQTLLGEIVYPDLHALPVKPDMVELFLAPDRTGPVIDAAIELEVPVVWMQIGVINEAGADKAEAAGLMVIMDRCPKQEIPRLGVPPAR